MRATLAKRFRFEAAHFLPAFPDGHKCRRVHGHSFRVDLVLEGELPAGQPYLIDFGEVKRLAGPIVDSLDHRLLNDIPGLENPSVEVIAKWIYERCKPLIPALKMVRVRETQYNICEYEG